MQRPTRAVVAMSVTALAFTVGMTSYAQQQAPAEPPVKKHTFDLDSSYIRLPLPASEQAYGRLDGKRIKQFVNEVTGVSRKSRDDGERYWGRIAGTKYDDMIEAWTEQKFKEFGLQNVNRQYFTLAPQFFPTDWKLTAT